MAVCVLSFVVGVIAGMLVVMIDTIRIIRRLK